MKWNYKICLKYSKWRRIARHLVYINPKIYYQVLQMVVGESVLTYKVQKGLKGKIKRQKENKSTAKVDSAFLLVETKAESAFGSAWLWLPFRLL